MSGETPEPEATGSLVVKVDSKTVYKAVRNYINNELKVEEDTIKAEVLAHAEKVARATIDDFFKEKRYNSANLEQRIGLYLDNWLKRDFEDAVKRAIAAQVREILEQQTLGVIEGIVTKGLEVRVGWNKTIKVRTTAAELPG